MYSGDSKDKEKSYLKYKSTMTYIFANFLTFKEEFDVRSQV